MSEKKSNTKNMTQRMTKKNLKGLIDTEIAPNIPLSLHAEGLEVTIYNKGKTPVFCTFSILCREE